MDNLRKVLNRLTQLASINHHCYLVSFFAQCRGVLFSDWQDDGAGKMRHSQHDSPLTPSPLSSSMKGKIFCILMPWELEKNAPIMHSGIFQHYYPRGDESDARGLRIELWKKVLIRAGKCKKVPSHLFAMPVTRTFFVSASLQSIAVSELH